MSEPTYRIELTHHPEEGRGLEWHAVVYNAAEYEAEPSGMFWSKLFTGYGPTLDEAFTRAQDWAKAKAQQPEDPRTLFLTEDGELLDPFDTVQT